MLKTWRREAFGTWCYRRREGGISWSDKIISEEVYERVNAKREIWNQIKKRIIKLIKYLLRYQSPLKIIIGYNGGKKLHGKNKVTVYETSYGIKKREKTWMENHLKPI